MPVFWIPPVYITEIATAPSKLKPRNAPRIWTVSDGGLLRSQSGIENPASTKL